MTSRTELIILAIIISLLWTYFVYKFNSARVFGYATPAALQNVAAEPQTQTYSD
jgi:hypothetical protein